ncbi:MAG: hypothetical protein D6730_19170 [Bacteroidetes bacterium]|nr:MAG: hypothetical protein D6730_19170 [Bacteroidota bacterium]
MSKPYLLFALLFSWGGLLPPAGAQPSQEPFVQYPLKVIDIINARHEPPPEVMGSPYLDKHFASGEVFYTTRNTLDEDFYFKKNHYDSIPLRYNIFTDEMEFYRYEEILSLLPMPMIEKVVIGRDTFLYRPHRPDCEACGGYFLLLENGRARLVAKLKVEYVEAKAARALQDPVPAHYVRRRDLYYLISPQGELHPITSVKNLLPLLQPYETELAAFAKKHKVSARKAHKLRLLIRAYNAMLGS